MPRSLVRSRVHLWCAVAITAAAAAAVVAGPLNPPAGPVSSTAKPLTDVEPRIALSSATAPGDADSVFRIATPGSYYLTSNLTGVSGKAGIKIVTSGVTIDLNGYTLSGVAGALDGIRTSGAIAFHRITIRNGVISDWPGSGIDLTMAGQRIGASCLIENIHASNNLASGIIGGFSSIVRECVAAGNTAIGISVPDGSVVEHCSVRQCSGDGILAQRGGTVSDCISQDNGGAGIHSTNGGTIARCTVNGNTGNGIFMDSTTVVGGSVTACQATANGVSGIHVTGAVAISQCAAAFNTSRGIEVHGGCTISACTAHANIVDGILCAGGPVNIIQGNVVLNNTCTSNGTGGDGDGIRVTGTGSRVEGNNCTNNTRGIRVQSAGNIFMRNTCSGNTSVNWNAVTGNFLNIISAANGGPVNGSSGGTSFSGASTDPNANFSY